MLTCRTVLVRVDQPAQGEGIHGQFFLAILAVCELWAVSSLLFLLFVS